MANRDRVSSRIERGDYRSGWMTTHKAWKKWSLKWRWLERVAVCLRWGFLAMWIFCRQTLGSFLAGGCVQSASIFQSKHSPLNPTGTRSQSQVSPPYSGTERHKETGQVPQETVPCSRQGCPGQWKVSACVASFCAADTHCSCLQTWAVSIWANSCVVCCGGGISYDSWQCGLILAGWSWELWQWQSSSTCSWRGMDCWHPPCRPILRLSNAWWRERRRLRGQTRVNVNQWMVLHQQTVLGTSTSMLWWSFLCSALWVPRVSIYWLGNPVFTFRQIRSCRAITDPYALWEATD